MSVYKQLFIFTQQLDTMHYAKGMQVLYMISWSQNNIKSKIVNNPVQQDNFCKFINSDVAEYMTAG